MLPIHVGSDISIAELRDAFQYLPQAIALFEAPSLHCRLLNPAMVQLLDLELDPAIADRATSLDLTQLHHWPTHLAEIALAMQEALQQCRRVSTAFQVIHYLPQEFMHRAGLEMSYVPIPNAAGEIQQILCTGHHVIGRPSGTPNKSTALPLGAQPIIGAQMPGLDQVIAREPGVTPEPSPASPITLATPQSPQPVAPPALTRLGEHSEEILWLVLDNIPQYIFWKDRNSNYLGCNRRWAEMAGIGNPQNVVGLSEYDLPWTKEQRDWYLQCDRQVMDTDIPMLQIRQSQQQADGQLTWREVNKLPLHDAAGNVIGLLGTIEDITEQKIAEDLLRESEARYRKLAQHEQVINQVAQQIRRSLNLETILQTVVKEVRKILDTDRTVIYQFSDQWRGIVVTEDVINPWRSVLGNMGADNCFPEGFANLYQEGRVRAINDLLDTQLDACHVEFLQGLQVQANLIVPIITEQKLWGLLIAHNCRSPRVWKESEIELLNYLAGQVGIAIRQANLYQEARENAAAAEAQTARLQATLQELQQTQTQLIQTEKMSSLGNLVAGVAHEINNPVNFIFGNISYIQSYVEDLTRLLQLYQHHYPQPVPEIADEIEVIELDFMVDDLTKVLASVRVGAERIREIVLSLRTFSRLDEAEMKAVDLHAGIDSTLLILQHRLKEHVNHPRITIERHYGELPEVDCYASQLNQVFMNILSNAIDALEAEPVPRDRPATITIKTEILPEAKWVRITIADNGPGIPLAIQQKLFDPFFTTKPVGKGTGLGLSISQQIVVDKHQGRLNCQSAPGAGTTFHIEIPIRQRI